MKEATKIIMGAALALGLLSWSVAGVFAWGSQVAKRDTEMLAQYDDLHRGCPMLGEILE